MLKVIYITQYPDFGASYTLDTPFTWESLGAPRRASNHANGYFRSTLWGNTVSESGVLRTHRAPKRANYTR